MTVCLGGRASATQRANSLDSLIREGASEACAIVCLRNEGPTAFEPETYGARIYIQRYLRRGGGTGSSSYKINKAGQNTVRMKRDTVSEICEHFSLQVENPLAVLTQETAKRFLIHAKNSDLFQVRGNQG